MNAMFSNISKLVQHVALPFAIVIIMIGSGFGQIAPKNYVPKEDRPPPSEDNKNFLAYSKWLSERGIESTPAGIDTYFKLLTPTDSIRNQTRDLIEKLSHSDYIVRENATKQLTKIPSITVQSIRELESKIDLAPEGRYRLRTVVDEKQAQSHAQLQYAIFKTIELGKFEGMASSIIEVYPVIEKDQFVASAMAKALQTVATPKDSALLKSTFESGDSDPDLKTGCLQGLAAVDSKSALAIAVENRNSAKGRLGLEIARVLVDAKDKKAFDVLLNLLSDKDNWVQFSALGVLRASTGLKYQSNYLTDESAIASCVEQTREWIKENGDKEIEWKWRAGKIRRGRRLISHYSKNLVTELDESGKVVWSVTAKSPFACLGLPNGHRLIVHYQSETIYEYDESGKKVRQINKISRNISGICLRDNGELIVAAGQNNKKLLVVGKNGSIQKTYTIEGTPTSVEIGLNGNMICALFTAKKIAEIDFEGKVVRDFKVEGKPYHCTPLENGNFLVAFTQGNKIAEYDPTGKEIWKHECEKGSYRAQLLDDGTIAYADADGIYRVNRAGKIISSTDLSEKGKIHYFHAY